MKRRGRSQVKMIAGPRIHVDEEDDEPFELLLEKLDHAILGLVEALDADDADLPRLIDESLNGSL